MRVFFEFLHGIQQRGRKVFQGASVEQNMKGRLSVRLSVYHNDVDSRSRSLGYSTDAELIKAQINAAQLGHDLMDMRASQLQPCMTILPRQQVIGL